MWVLVILGVVALTAIISEAYEKGYGDGYMQSTADYYEGRAKDDTKRNDP